MNTVVTPPADEGLRFATIRLKVAESTKGSTDLKLVRDNVRVQVFESDNEERMISKLLGAIDQRHGEDQLCALKHLHEYDPDGQPGVYTIEDENVLLGVEDVVKLAFRFIRAEV
jgi:hypothetical protein